MGDFVVASDSGMHNRPADFYHEITSGDGPAKIPGFESGAAVETIKSDATPILPPCILLPHFEVAVICENDLCYSRFTL